MGLDLRGYGSFSQGSQRVFEHEKYFSNFLFSDSGSFSYKVVQSVFLIF